MLVEYNSLIYQKYPKCLFESFESKKTPTGYDIKISLSTRDFYTFADKKTSWFYESKSKYLYIKTFAITDQKIFNSIDNSNYLDILEGKNNNFINKTISIRDFFGDKSNIDSHESEHSTNDAIFYKFLYSMNISVPKSNFIGFISYAYYDYKQFCLDSGKNILSLKTSNKGFTIEKFVCVVNDKKNYSIQRITTKDKKTWLADFKQNGRDIVFNDGVKDTKLYLNVQKVKIIDADIYEKLSPSPIDISLRQDYNKNFNKVSLLGNVFNYIDGNFNLNIAFPFDLMNFCCKNSNIFKYINVKRIDLQTLNGIKYASNIQNSYVLREDINSKETEVLYPMYNPKVRLMDNKLDKSSLSNIGLITVLDNEIKNKTPSKYSYKIFFKVEDGFKKMLDALISESKKQLAIYNEYSSHCRQMSSILDKNKNYINYDFHENRFKLNFINEQSKKNSLWTKCLKVGLVYLKLLNLIEFKDQKVSYLDIMFYISPENASLDNIEKFNELFLQLINKAETITNSQQGTVLDGEVLLINSINSYNDSTYYDYYNSYTDILIKNIKDNNSVGCFLQPKRIVNFQTDTITQTALSSKIIDTNLESFRISKQAEDLIIDYIIDKTNNQHVSPSLIPYELMYDYNQKIYDFNKKKLKLTSVADFNSYLLSLRLPVLKSIYKLLYSSSYNAKTEKDINTKQQYATEIFNVLQNRAKFLLEFYSLYSNNKICVDYKKILLFGILYGKTVKIEYMDGFKRDSSGLLNLKEPIWKLFDFTDPNIGVIIKNRKLFVRLVRLNLDSLMFPDNNRIDLSILNEYTLVE